MTNKWKDGLPPVGEECEITVLDTDGLFRNCKILYIDSMSVVFSSSAASSMPKYLSEVKFRPLKTPDEIERERVVELAKEVCYPVAATSEYVRGIDYAIDSLLGAGLLHDKKVKPITGREFKWIVKDSISFDHGFSKLLKMGCILEESNQ